MKKASLLSLIAMVILASCSESGFKNGKGGVKYKIVSGKETTKLKVGNYLQIAVTQKFGDSATFNTYEAGHEFLVLDTSNQPFDIKPILRMMNVSDSAMVKLNVDSIYAMQFKMGQQQNPGMTKEQFESQLPSFFKKKGQYITLGLRAIKQYNIDSTSPTFKNDTALLMRDQKEQGEKRKAYQEKMQAKQMEEQKKKDEVGFKTSKADFEKFVGSNANVWKKTPSGAYVQIITEGTGEPCVTGKLAELRYTGMLMSTKKVFDSNVKGAKPGDTTTKPTLPVTVNGGGTVKGFDEGIAMLRKGTVAKLYIPAELGYGGQGQGADIPAFSNLIFDITVEDVKVAPAPQAQRPQQKMTPEQQAAMMEQMKQQQAQKGGQ
jgi:FKBP-type peptidyl-prolyl cis-trans isomerase FkpA